MQVLAATKAEAILQHFAFGHGAALDDTPTLLEDLNEEEEWWAKQPKFDEIPQDWFTTEVFKSKITWPSSYGMDNALVGMKSSLIEYILFEHRKLTEGDWVKLQPALNVETLLQRSARFEGENLLAMSIVDGLVTRLPSHLLNKDIICSVEEKACSYGDWSVLGFVARQGKLDELDKVGVLDGIPFDSWVNPHGAEFPLDLKGDSNYDIGWDVGKKLPPIIYFKENVGVFCDLIRRGSLDLDSLVVNVFGNQIPGVGCSAFDSFLAFTMGGSDKQEDLVKTLKLPWTKETLGKIAPEFAWFPEAVIAYQAPVEALEDLSGDIADIDI